MVHIRSDDVMAGTTTNGTWDLQQFISGFLTVLWHHVDDGDMPWIYTGVEVLIIDVGGVDYTVIFSQQSADKTLAAVATQLTTDLDAGLGGSGITVASLVYTAATDTFDIVFSGAVTLEWSNVLTTSDLVWNETADSATSVNQTFSARHATSRPASMELDIVEGSAINSSRNTSASMIIPLHDHIAQGSWSIENHNTELNIVWSRTNAPGVECPFTQQWEILFSN